MPRLRTLALAAALGGALLVPATSALADAPTVVWTGGSDGTSWTDPGNWSTDAVPGPSDSVLVEAYTDTVCHAHIDSVPDGTTLAGLTVDELLYQNDPDSPCLTSITGGSITITGQLTFHAGTIDTPVTIASGATATITPGAANDTTHLSQALTVQGGLTLASNSGGRYLSLTGSSGITIAAGATLTTQGDNLVSSDCCLANAHLINNGSTTIGAGTLSLSGVGLDQNATLSAGVNAAVETSLAAQTAGPGAKWKGAGSWLMQYGDITASGTQALSGGFHWVLGGNGSASEERLHGTFALAGTGTFDWAGGELEAALTLGHTITAVADGPDGADTRYLAGSDGSTPVAGVTVHGTLAFRNGAGYYGVANGKLTVASDGALALDPGTSIGADCCSPGSTIVNAGGSVTVPAASAGATPVLLDDIGYRATGGTTSIGTNAAVVASGGSTGLLSNTAITGGGTFTSQEPMTITGTESIGSATTFGLDAGGSLTSSGSAVATIGGAGQFAWTGGGFIGKFAIATSAQSISGAATKRVYVPSGRTMSTVSFAGATTVAFGSANNPNTVESDPGGQLAFTGTLSLGGHVQFFGGKVTTSGTTTVRAGASDAYVEGNATLTNSGKLTVATGTLRADNDLVQTAGSTAIAAGASVIMGSSAKFKLQGGTLSGSGTLSGALFDSGGTVSPGSTGIGTLTVTGAYTSGAAAVIAVDVSATGNDVLAIGGPATLYGTLIANDLGSYVPAAGATATVLTASSVTKRLACVQTTGAGAATQHWTAAVSGSTLRLLSVDGAPPTC